MKLLFLYKKYSCAFFKKKQFKKGHCNTKFTWSKMIIWRPLILSQPFCYSFAIWKKFCIWGGGVLLRRLIKNLIYNSYSQDGKITKYINVNNATYLLYYQFFSPPLSFSRYIVPRFWDSPWFAILYTKSLSNTCGINLSILYNFILNLLTMFLFL